MLKKVDPFTFCLCLFAMWWIQAQWAFSDPSIELVSPNEQANGRFGISVSSIPDVDGDDRDDVIVGAKFEGPSGSPSQAGRAYIFSGATGGLLRTLVSPNEETDGNFGSSVSGIPDVDGDGRGDVIVGARKEDPGASPSQAGRAYIFSGATGLLLHTLKSPNEATNTSPLPTFSISVAGIRDVNSDGRGDVVVGAYRESPGASPEFAGRAYVFSGATGALLHTLKSPNEQFHGFFGFTVSGISDANGDGRGDVIVGAHQENPGAAPNDAGRAYIFSGATGGWLNTLASPNPETLGLFGGAVSGISDVDGDGRGDVVVGASGEGLTGNPVSGGRAYIFSGATGAFLQFLASGDGAEVGVFGVSVSGMPDSNGDGRGDVIVGATGDVAGGSPNAVGRAYIFSGATGALLSIIASPNAEARGDFGVSVSGISDMNGDGRGDVIVGAEREDPGAAPDNAGRAYIMEPGPPEWFSVQLDVDGNPQGLALASSLGYPRVLWNFPSPDSATNKLKYARLAGLRWFESEIPDVTGPIVSADLVRGPDKFYHAVWSDRGMESIRYARAGFISTFSNLQTVDSFGSWFKGGVESSIGVGTNGIIQVAYFYAPGEDLRYSSRNGDTDWVTERTTVDSAGRVGKGAHLTLDNFDNAHIVYIDQDNGTIKYATNSGGSFTSETIIAGSASTPHIEVDPQGIAHVMISNESTNTRTYVRRTGGVGGNPWAVFPLPIFGIGRNNLAIDSMGRIHTFLLEDSGSRLKHFTFEAGIWSFDRLPSELDGFTPADLVLDKNDNLFATAKAPAPDKSVHLISNIDLPRPGTSLQEQLEYLCISEVACALAAAEVVFALLVEKGLAVVSTVRSAICLGAEVLEFDPLGAIIYLAFGIASLADETIPGEIVDVIACAEETLQEQFEAECGTSNLTLCCVRRSWEKWKDQSRITRALKLQGFPGTFLTACIASPVDISITAANGESLRYVDGQVVETPEAPGWVYRLGDPPFHKYALFLGPELPVTVDISLDAAFAIGSFEMALALSSEVGDSLIVSYPDVVLTTDGSARIVALSPDTQVLPVLEVDSDGDGVVDAIVEPLLVEQNGNVWPHADAGPDQTVECSRSAGGMISLDGTNSFDPDLGDVLSYQWLDSQMNILGTDPLVDLTLPFGEHLISLVVTDSLGGHDVAVVAIGVVDTTPPELSVSVSPDVLWPPNHKLVEITPTVSVNDLCDPSPTVQLISIVMDEGDEENTFFGITDDTLGDGHTVGDIQIEPDGTLFLRAERSGLGDGRVYTLMFRAVDNAGNEHTATATVTVPHDQP